MSGGTGAARRLAITGAALVLLGLLTGLVSGQMANPRMGLSSHLAGMMGGTLLLALAAIWPMVRLLPRVEAWAVSLLGFGFTANWLATLLAALWGAGGESMPIAGAGHSAAPWQEGLVTTLLIALSLRHSGPAGAFPQGEGRRAALLDHLGGGGNQSLAQVAVMIGPEFRLSRHVTSFHKILTPSKSILTMSINTAHEC